MSARSALKWPDRIVPGEGARLLPDARIGGPMPWVIAIMVALTVIAIAAALALDNVADNARGEIAGGLTVQVIEGAPAARAEQTKAVLDLLEGHRDIAEYREVSSEELSQLLEPWLGTSVNDEDSIVTPSLIDVQMKGSVTASRLRQLRDELTRIAPDARLDAQANWLRPVFDAIAALQVLALGLVLLLMATTAAAVWLAARSALGTNSKTIEVIHHLGGNDSQIAGIFQRSIAIDAAIGGLAGLALGGAAILVLGQQFAQLGSGLVAGGGLGLTDWLAIIAVPLAGILLAMLTARITVLVALRKML